MPVRNLRDEFKARKAAKRKNSADGAVIEKCYARKEALKNKADLVTRREELIERRSQFEHHLKFFRRVNKVAERKVIEAATRKDDSELSVALDALTNADELEVIAEEKLHNFVFNYDARLEQFNEKIDFWESKLLSHLKL